MAKAKAGIQHALIVQPRAISGRRPVRRLRLTGTVPGVVYGKQMKPVAVSVEARALAKLLHSATGEHALVALRLEGDGAWEKPVLVRAIQYDPVDGRVVHVDFHAIVLTERLKVKVPVVLKGEAVGVKQDGGVLEHFLREVEVECLPAEMPTSVEFDISPLKIGDTVHVSELTPPKNAKITTDPTGVIASVQQPREEKPEEAAAAAPTEPEVLREKKEEPEAAEAAPAKGDKGEAADSKKEAKETK